MDVYCQFFIEIGYLFFEFDDFIIIMFGVDVEIIMIVGFQLVVLVFNVWFVLNVVNVCWGFFYDVLYGIDVIFEIDGVEKGFMYNKVCGDKVIVYVCKFFDDSVLLLLGFFGDVIGFIVQDGQFVVVLLDKFIGLVNFGQFVGYIGVVELLILVLLINYGLYIEILIDLELQVGIIDWVGVKDVILEFVIIMIMDFEDLVVVVDVVDKVLGYWNWFGLNKGDLVVVVDKDGIVFLWVFNRDWNYIVFGGGQFMLFGCSFMFVCNVGYLMMNDVIVDIDGSEVFEGIMDVLFIGLIVIYGLKVSDVNGLLINSCIGFIYIVKLKMYGLVEVVFICELFSWVEDVLGLL